MDYGVVLISHAVDKTFKDEQGNESNQIVPTLSNKPRNIVSRMCDIIGYSRSIENADGSTSTKLFMRGTPRYVAGSRFKYTPDVIEFSYQSLVDAICDAIDKQMEEDGIDYFTEERSNIHNIIVQELNFDDVMDEFNGIINGLVEKHPDDFESYWQPRITEIIEKYLGKGMKVSQCSRAQVEALDLIVTELRDIVK